MVELEIGRLLDASEAGEGIHKSVSYLIFCIELSPQMDEAIVLLGAFCPVLVTLKNAAFAVAGMLSG